MRLIFIFTTGVQCTGIRSARNAMGHQKADPTTTWDFRNHITDKCLRDWPLGQSNGFGEYRTSKDSMR